MVSREGKGFVVGTIFIILALVVGFIYWLGGWSHVQNGYGGVVHSMNGGVQDQALPQGWHWIGWTKFTKDYPTSTESVTLDKNSGGTLKVSTAEGKQVEIEVKYSYHVEFDKLASVYKKFRGQDTTTIENGFIKNTLIGAIQNVTSQYPVLEIYGVKRDEITKKVRDDFTQQLAPLGITVELYSFGQIIPDEQTLKSIQDIVNAQNGLKQAELTKQNKQIEAEQKRIEAQGIADKARIEAEGQAAANKALQQSISQELLEMKRIEAQMEFAKNQNLPRVIGSNGNMLNIPSEMFNIPTAKK